VGNSLGGSNPPTPTLTNSLSSVNMGVMVNRPVDRGYEPEQIIVVQATGGEKLMANEEGKHIDGEDVSYERAAFVDSPIGSDKHAEDQEPGRADTTVEAGSLDEFDVEDEEVEADAVVPAPEDDEDDE
jgi:hypothetical protein